MRRHRRIGGLAAVAVLAAVPAPAAGTAAPPVETGWSVLAAEDVNRSAAVAAIRRAGGQVIAGNAGIGLYEVRAPASFAGRAAAETTLVGAARRAPIGRAPLPTGVAVTLRPIPQEALPLAARPAGPAGLDPLDDKAWGLTMTQADRARAVTPGDRRVTVGIIDTGLDATNPDLLPGFNRELSRNFAPDIADIDGPCEMASCLDPVGTDDSGHGTHVAGVVGAAANGTGLSGVAPKVSLVELKSGQDSAYFFLQPVVDALTYAADAGIDVVNMSFYLDPWLYNCYTNPADSPERQAEQRTIIAAMSRALNYAHARGVTVVGALGNQHVDLGHPRADKSSPDYPGGSAYERPIDNATCFSLPVEGPHVLGVGAVGPSGRKPEYANYGREQISFAAPGGWLDDDAGPGGYGNLILSTFPRKVLQEVGLVDENGAVLPAGVGFVFRYCDRVGRCGYAVYQSGTSMAAPFVTAVAALVVGRYGHPDPRHHGGLTLAPDKVQSILERSAAEHECPQPPLVSYDGLGDEWDALCEGDASFNGFYGHGLIDAYAAISPSRWK